MRIPSKSFRQNTQNSSFENNQDPQRQSSRNECPGRKLINKREAVKKGLRKANSTELQHDKFSTDQNRNSIFIEETTQQGSTEVSMSHDSKYSEDPTTNSIGFDFGKTVRNSNSDLQRSSDLIEYLDSISDHMLKKEELYIPKPIADPENISECSRTKLAVWMIELSNRFKFKQETALSAINIVDRALGMMRISLDRFPLLGITALFMATKYEEIMIPHLTNFVAVVPEMYKVTKQTILKLESMLLQLLDFDLGYASPLIFINHTDLVSSLPEFVRNRAAAIAKELIVSSECRFWGSSRLAVHAIRVAEQDYQCASSENNQNMASQVMC